MTDNVRPLPEELVNPASANPTLRPDFMRGQANQPDSAFPQLPGIILETLNLILSFAAQHLSSFKELPTSYQKTSIRQ
jgi:hypothetical protein